MEKLKTQTVYTEVPVSERLPISTSNKADYCYTDNGIMWNQRKNGVWYKPGASVSRHDEQPQFWLEKKEDQIVMPLEEFKKAIGDAFEAGFKKCGENMIDHLIEISNPAPDKKQYIINL